MNTTTHHRWRPLAVPLGLALAVAAGACSDRQVEPDISDEVELACTSDCTNGHECGVDPFHETAEECISECVGAERWETLNQCTSAWLAWQSCRGTLTCEQLGEYEAWVLEGGPLSASFPCYDEADAFYNCDTSKPFEEGE